MLSSEDFGREFVHLVRDKAISEALGMVAGVYKSEFHQRKYKKLYKKYDDIELFRKVAAVAVDSTCLKLLEFVASGHYTHTPIEGNPDLSNEMFKDGGWIDRFSIFSRR